MGQDFSDYILKVLLYHVFKGACSKAKRSRETNLNEVVKKDLEYYKVPLVITLIRVK